MHEKTTEIGGWHRVVLTESNDQGSVSGQQLQSNEQRRTLSLASAVCSALTQLALIDANAIQLVALNAVYLLARWLLLKRKWDDASLVRNVPPQTTEGLEAFPPESAMAKHNYRRVSDAHSEDNALVVFLQVSCVCLSE